MAKVAVKSVCIDFAVEFFISRHLLPVSFRSIVSMIACASQTQGKNFLSEFYSKSVESQF